MLRWTSLLGGIAMVVGGLSGLAAQERNAQGAGEGQDLVVIELFTSQGCSSCPPADRLLGQLRERPDILALTFNVDYWDYLGWKDTLASPTWTERQRGYQRTLGGRYVYTPQLVIGGARHVVGSNQSDAEREIQRLASRRLAELQLISATSQDVRIKLQPKATLPAGARAALYLVRYEPQQTVAIGRGENAGHSITYYNVVRQLERLESWSGGEVREFTIAGDKLSGPLNAAVFVQAEGAGPSEMLAALRLSPALRASFLQ